MIRYVLFVLNYIIEDMKVKKFSCEKIEIINNYVIEAVFKAAEENSKISTFNLQIRCDENTDEVTIAVWSYNIAGDNILPATKICFKRGSDISKELVLWTLESLILH